MEGEVKDEGDEGTRGRRLTVSNIGGAGRGEISSIITDAEIYH